MKKKLFFKMRLSHIHKILFVCVLALCFQPTFAQTCQCDRLGTFVGTGVNKEFFSELNLSSLVEDEVFIVCGTFRIDESPWIQNSLFLMEEDAEIIVESTNFLFLFNDTVQGCSGMWKSITIEDGAGIYAGNSFIYDAYDAAILGNDGSTVNTAFTNYDRNEVSVRVQTPNLLAYGNTFRANAFNFGFTGANTDRPFIGIEVIVAECHIGGESDFPNVFKGPFYYGIHTTESPVMITDNEFLDINRLTSGVNWIGTAIQGENFSFLEIEDNKFDNITEGVQLENWSSGYISNNTFSNYSIACGGAISSPAFVDVNNNTIGNENGAGAIGVSFTSAGGRLITADNNIITDNRDGPAGTLYGGRSITHSGKAAYNIIRDNTCKLIHDGNNAGTGIYLLGARNGVVLNNSLNIDSGSDAFTGINLIGSTASQVEENYVNATTKGSNIGISASNAMLSNFCCNVDTLLDIGIYITRGCDNSILATSEIFDCNVGVEVEFRGVLGPQLLTGNRWFGNYTNWGARNNNTDRSIVESSLFTVPGLSQPEGPGSHTPQDWFDEFSQGTDYPCASIDACTNGDVVITPYDTLFAIGYLDTILDAGALWMRKIGLFGKIYENSSLYGVHQGVDDWYDNQLSGVVEAYYLKRDSIDRIFKVNETDQDTLDIMSDSLQRYFDTLAVMDSIIFEDTITNWSNYDSARSVVLNKIDSFYNGFINKTRKILDNRYDHAQNLITTNAALSAPDHPSYYERMYHDILLKTIASKVDTFTSAQKDSLNLIANLCPDHGGRVVYWARSLYQYIERTWFDEELICTPSSQIVRKPQTKQEDLNQQLSLAPTPSNEFVRIIGYGDFDQKELKGTIYDLSGQEMWRGQLGIGQKIDVSQLPIGLYILRVELRNGDFENLKMVIQR